MHIILPGTKTDLLHQELAPAFNEAGCRVTRVAPANMRSPRHPRRIEQLLDGKPTLIFSVNGRGIFPLSPLLKQLSGKNADMALWFVDNPWNVLAAEADPAWKKLLLFVTDASFIPGLRRHGAQRVFHLPLAASPVHFTEHAIRNHAFPPPKKLAPFVFVGRSAFPGKERFFSGLCLPDVTNRLAREMLRNGRRPDFLWWEGALGLAEAPLWPSRAARTASYGAEQSNLAWRSRCLAAMAKAGKELAEASDHDNDIGLDIFGDQGWQGALPANARLRRQVDYYARLPGIYAASRYSVCLTSLQLPAGLNQRHFDVWMAGGFCLMDKSPGLSLFPEELTGPVVFTHPSMIGEIARSIERSGIKASLAAAWREHIAAHHTYRERVGVVLKTAFTRSA